MILINEYPESSCCCYESNDPEEDEEDPFEEDCEFVNDDSNWK